MGAAAGDLIGGQQAIVGSLHGEQTTSRICDSTILDG